MAIVRDLSRDLVSDSGAALADFKAIPVLNGGSASINVCVYVYLPMCMC